jgi:hypothetical protein
MVMSDINPSFLDRGVFNLEKTPEGFIIRNKPYKSTKLEKNNNMQIFYIILGRLRPRVSISS